MEARKDELNDFVKLVGNTIGYTCVAIGKAESVDDISSLIVNNQRKVIEKFAQGDEIDVYPSTSWCRFCWYETDFGWGKPFWVTLVECDAFEGISLMDTKDGDGIEAWVSLMENGMAQFERDPNILRITRGTPMHVQVVDNRPSFSLSLTQDFGVNAGSIARSKQIQEEKSIEELKSKKKMTQLHSRKLSIKPRQATLKLLKEEARGKPKTGILIFPSYINTTRPKIVTRRFICDALAIANLKNTIEDLTAIRPTRVVLIMSLIWKVLVGISTAKNGHSRNSSLLFLINLRGKSNMEARKDELNDFVKLVGNTIGDTCVAIGKAESVDDISSLIVNNQRKVIEKFAQGDEIDVYPSTSWCRFCWYETDFGWGKPFWVSLVECDAFDGIEAWVSLKENDMAQFERGPNILSSTSKLAFHSFG
ncbi:hypothetical protein H5410_064294 [Solanum commersonii]|uniref:Uncharacterized protein n=1 Tax=Solanum commersonii TaxID=4109 RepID=A0A9J5W021_SOLCO|nr:hypothetical protein H5410_064294 [Solanum commersonii]